MVDTEGKPAFLAYIEADSELLDEMMELCQSAGYSIISTINQKRRGPDPRFYLGPGKIREIEPVEGVEHLIIARELTPKQMYNIATATGFTVVDRTRVILDIFRKRAYSPEARLQLEIADLQYQLPLMREYIHQGKLSERPGFMAGGEYKIDYYYELSKKRISQMRAELEGLRRKRGVRRKQRRRKGTHTISIAGYTNAGKSTLMNRLMDPARDNKTAEEGGAMFTTISTTTRRMKGSRNCIVTDTVGFISDLPPWLVEGFMSTLEEIFSSEIVLLLVDSSDPMGILCRKIEDSISLLREGGTSGKIILVLNKIDLLDGNGLSSRLEDRMDEDDLSLISAMVEVSAIKEKGIGELLGTIEGLLPPLLKVEYEMPLGKPADAVISEIRKDHDADIAVRDDGTVVVSTELEERFARSFEKKVRRLGGKSRVELVDASEKT